MVSDKISLHRLHTMFSLLSLKRAYVVTAGRLVGVVAVSELTKGNSFSFIYMAFLLARNSVNTDSARQK